jgi:hypothetical protein
MPAAVDGLAAVAPAVPVSVAAARNAVIGTIFVNMAVSA